MIGAFGSLCLTLASMVFRIASKMRLIIPFTFMVLMLTVFHDWYVVYPKIGDGIFFVLLGLCLLSWLTPLFRRIQRRFENKKIMNSLAEQLHFARTHGKQNIRIENNGGRVYVDWD